METKQVQTGSHWRMYVARRAGGAISDGSVAGLSTFGFDGNTPSFYQTIACLHRLRVFCAPSVFSMRPTHSSKHQPQKKEMLSAIIPELKLYY